MSNKCNYITNRKNNIVSFKQLTSIIFCSQFSIADNKSPCKLHYKKITCSKRKKFKKFNEHQLCKNNLQLNYESFTDAPLLQCLPLLFPTVANLPSTVDKNVGIREFATRRKLMFSTGWWSIITGP